VPRRPQFLFLLRASLLFMAMLALWGAVLLDPLRAALRVFTVAAIWLIPGDRSVTEAAIQPNGDWSLRLPMPAAVARLEPVQQMFGRTPMSGRTSDFGRPSMPGSPSMLGRTSTLGRPSEDLAPIRVRSLKLVIEGKYPVLFMAGLPFYWALILASGWTWRRGRALLRGSGVLFVIAAASLLFYVIRTAIKNTHLIAGGPVGFLLDSGEYFAVDVVPYLAPLLLALYLDVDLRALVFTRQADDSRSAPPGTARQRARQVR
jgi:hypothetical protein